MLNARLVPHAPSGASPSSSAAPLTVTELGSARPIGPAPSLAAPSSLALHSSATPSSATPSLSDSPPPVAPAEPPSTSGALMVPSDTPHRPSDALRLAAQRADVLVLQALLSGADGSLDVLVRRATQSGDPELLEALIDTAAAPARAERCAPSPSRPLARAPARPCALTLAPFSSPPARLSTYQVSSALGAAASDLEGAAPAIASAFRLLHGRHDVPLDAAFLSGAPLGRRASLDAPGARVAKGRPAVEVPKLGVGTTSDSLAA